MRSIFLIKMFEDIVSAASSMLILFFFVILGSIILYGLLWTHSYKKKL